MNIERLLSHLHESMNVGGDIIEFGAHGGATFKHLVACAMKHSRIAYAIDSFEGLDEPSKFDYNENNTISYPKGKFKIGKDRLVSSILYFIHGASNYTIIDDYIDDAIRRLDVESKYAFAFIDLVHYEPTKIALDYIWDKMSYGATIYLDNYFPSTSRLCSLAIADFINLHSDEIIVSRQMLINGKRESELAIKCLRRGAKKVINIDAKNDSRDLVVALVLKTGGEYTYEHVNNIAKSIKKNITGDYTLVCFTNDSANFNMDYIDGIIPFKHSYPTWWGKVELFRPNLFNGEQILYFDLDTFIVDNIDDIANYRGDFSALRDFYHLYSMGSGVMSWNSDKMTHIYQRFQGQENKIINGYREGDQRWIDENKQSIDFMQDMFPNKIVSYKVHCKKQNSASVPCNASVVCFHGPPRPHTVQDVELKKYWNP